MPVLPTVPLNDAKFTLDTSGLTGFFGGEEIIQAMATIHLSKGRRWLGWYNSPGSRTVAQEFSKILTSPASDSRFPSLDEISLASFGLDERVGPKFVALLSGIVMQSGYLGYLTMKMAKDEEYVIEVKGRKTALCKVAFLELMNINYSQDVPIKSILDALLALIPMLVSCSASIMCALVGDWYCFAMIILGMVSSGVAHLVIGSAPLIFDTGKNPAELGAPPGHGMLVEGNTVVVVKGAEKNVNAVTKGRFLLRIPRGSGYHNFVVVCSSLFFLQFFLQLLLIPQGLLFGQVMFLASITVSWVYNSYLALREKGKILTKTLSKCLGSPRMSVFILGTRTTMSVFVCLICIEMASPHGGMDPEKMLQSLLPNNTKVWERWRNKVVRQMKESDLSSEKESLTCLEVDEVDKADFQSNDNDIRLLTTLVADAKSAFEGYRKHHTLFVPPLASEIKWLPSTSIC